MSDEAVPGGHRGYPPQTIVKVERLLEFLVDVGGHPYLGRAERR